jgi:hypothetical protein
MGNTPSVFVDTVLSEAHHVRHNDEGLILDSLSRHPVVSYIVTKEVFTTQVLKFDSHIDVVDSFSCLTLGGRFDILIDGVKHYQNIEKFTLVPVAVYKSTVTIQLHTPGPIVFICKGYTCAETERMLLAMHKIKTRTTKYNYGVAKKLHQQSGT